MKMKITKRQCFWSAAAVLYVLFIFSNSMKNADLSSADSGAVLRLVQQVLTAGGVDGTIITEHVIRKTAHFTEYAALGNTALPLLSDVCPAAAQPCSVSGAGRLSGSVCR